MGQKSKARTFKYQGANGKLHTAVKKNNTNSIASEFFPTFVASVFVLRIFFGFVKILF